MSPVRKLGVIAMAVLALTLAACTSSAVATSTTSSTGSTTTAPTTTTTPRYSSIYPVAISFSDAEHGLLLVQGCGTSICRSWVEITADGGEHWLQRAAFSTYPAADYDYGQGVVIKNPNQSGADAAFLASASGGWAYGPGLFVTRDGGRRFRRVKVRAAVLAVAAFGDHVWVLEQRCHLVKETHATLTACARTVLLNGPSDGDGLRPVAKQPPGFPPTPGDESGTQFPLEIVQAEPNLLVLAGVFFLDVTTDGGRTWLQSRYPCRQPYANGDWPGFPAVDPSGSLWLICAGAPRMGFQRKQLWRSFDSGKSWVGPFQLSPGGYAVGLDAVTPTEAWAYGGRAPIFHSVDGGRSWKAMLVGRFNNATGGPRGFSAVGVEDAWNVAPQVRSTPFPTELLRTVDGGRSWTSIQLRA